jgi:hypothetical protein
LSMTQVMRNWLASRRSVCFIIIATVVHCWSEDISSHAIQYRTPSVPAICPFLSFSCPYL